MLDIKEEDILSNWVGDINNPLVTIRVLSYNHAGYIEKAIDGFLMQKTTFPFEILIHDDASTDGTDKIIKKYEKKYPNIINAIYEKENQFSKRDGSLRRIMDSNTRGKYVAYCESDDYWISPNKLEMQIEYMENHPHCSMTYHAVNYEELGDITCNDRRYDFEQDVSVSDIIEGGGLFIATASICAVFEFIKDRPKFWIMSDVGDYPLQISLALQGTVHYFPDIMAVYRYCRPGSWTSSAKSTKKLIKHLNNEVEWMEELDSFTNYKYTSSIKSKIAEIYMELYKCKSCSFVECLNRILSMENNKQKLGRIKWLIRSKKIHNE